MEWMNQIMVNEPSQEKNTAILAAMDQLMAGAAWNESTFFRVMGNQLRGLRTRFAEQTQDLSNNSTKVAADLLSRIAMRRGQREIFISLYCSDGTLLPSWEKLILNLSQQTTSRPIYASEADVQAMIATKENKVNEAYVSIYVDQNCILPSSQDNPSVDKLGHSLLILKNNAVTLKNIHFFVHGLQRYEYAQGKLFVIH